MTLKSCIGVLVCIAWAPLVLADENNAAVTPTSATASGGKDIDISQIIAAVGQKTHRKFLIDPRVRAVVSLVGIDAREVSYPLLQTILAVHGFSTYEQDGVVVVMPDANERQVPSPVMSANAIHGADAEFITVIKLVKNMSAAQLVPVLRPLMPQNAQLSQVTGTNALIIADRAANVRRLVEIIEELEKMPVEKGAEEKGQ